MNANVESKPALLAWVAGLPTLPVLWVVLMGMVVSMHVRMRWRPLARDIVNSCGGWRGVPAGAAMAAWRVLRRWPLLIWAVAGFVALIVVLLSGFRAIPGALFTALIAAVIAPAVADEAALLLSKTGNKWLWPDD
jgi:hypothetical protein